MIRYTDNTRMPIGKFKGTAMINVPASHLLWLWENATNIPEALRLYIKDNLDVIKTEVKRARQNNAR